VDDRHWKSLLNKSVALIGLRRLPEAQSALQKAFKLSGVSTRHPCMDCHSALLCNCVCPVGPDAGRAAIKIMFRGVDYLLHTTNAAQGLAAGCRMRSRSSRA